MSIEINPEQRTEIIITHALLFTIALASHVRMIPYWHQLTTDVGSALSLWTIR